MDLAAWDLAAWARDEMVVVEGGADVDLLVVEVRVVVMAHQVAAVAVVTVVVAAAVVETSVAAAVEVVGTSVAEAEAAVVVAVEALALDILSRETGRAVFRPPRKH